MAHLLANFPTLSKSLITQQKTTNGSKTKSTAVTTSARNPLAAQSTSPGASSKKTTASSKAVSNKIGQALRARFGSDIFSTNEKKKTKKKATVDSKLEKANAATAADDHEDDVIDEGDISDQDGFDDDVDLMAVAESGGDLMNDSSDDGGSGSDGEDNDNEDDDMELDALLSSIGKSQSTQKSATDSNNNAPKKKSATAAATAKKVVNSAKAVVIVNNGNTGRRDPSMGGAREWRTFMTSDVGKMLAEPKPKTPLTKEEEELDRQDNANDRELMDLLQTSKLIEDFNASELFGKDRRKYLENKLHELGAKKAPNPKMPFPDRLKMIKAEEKRMQQRLTKAKESGMYHSSMKTHIMAGGDKEKALKLANAGKKSGSGKRGEPKALDGGVGHFRNGTLHVGQRAVEAVSKLGKKKGRGAGQSVGMGIKITGSSSGGGGGGGGGKAGKKKKGGKKFKKR